VRGGRYREAMAEWARIHALKPLRTRHFADQPAWNKLLLGGNFTASPFERADVVFPACFDRAWHDWRRAPLCHFCGSMDAAMKLEFMFGAYAMRFFGDAAPLMIDLLELTTCSPQVRPALLEWEAVLQQPVSHVLQLLTGTSERAGGQVSPVQSFCGRALPSRADSHPEGARGR